MNWKKIGNPKSVIAAMAFAGLAWLVIWALRSPAADELEEKVERAEQSVAPLLIRD